MGNLTGVLAAATRTLSSYSQALGVVQDNIANVATPGYARQRVSLAPILVPITGQNLGVEISSIQSLRDNLLEAQVRIAGQTSSFFGKTAQIIESLEPAFRLSGGNSLGESIDSFFAAASALSVSPDDFNLRRGLLNAADRLASTFRKTNFDLSRVQTSVDTEINSTVRHVNSLLQQAADLGVARGSSPDGSLNSSAETRLSQVLGELSELIGFRVLDQRDGTLTIVGSGGTPLAVGATVFPLTVSIGADSATLFAFGDTDVTAAFIDEGGSLAALLDARNNTLPRFLGEIDRLAKSVADQVNEQFLRGATITGGPGVELFTYATSFFEGTGRTAGTAGAATPAPPVSIDVTFSGGVTGSITAVLDSFFVAAAAPAGPAAGDTASITFTSADGSIERTITTAPLLGSEDAAALATRLNDQIALDPDLAGLITFSDSGGSIKVVLSDQAGQGFTFTSETSNVAFTTGLEAGGTLGGHSAEEIAAALNAEVAADAALTAAGIRFSAVQGEVRIDGDDAFDFTIVDNDPAVTGFVSGLAGSGSAGGAPAATTLSVANIGLAEVSAGTLSAPDGNGTVLAVTALADAPVVGGLTFTDFYANLVTEVGDAGSAAQSQFETQELVFIAAQNTRDAFSGVDINEESIQLVQFEQAYQAMLRVIQIVDSLASELLTLGR